MGSQQEPQASSRTGWDDFLPSAAPPSPVEMLLALRGTKPSGDTSKAPQGVGSYRQWLAQGLLTAWWLFTGHEVPVANLGLCVPSCRSQLTAMHFSKAVILSWATSSRMATYM